MLPTRAFLVPLEEDEEIEVTLARGQAISIKYKAVSELQPNGKRCAAKLAPGTAPKHECRRCVLEEIRAEQVPSNPTITSFCAMTLMPLPAQDIIKVQQSSRY